MINKIYSTSLVGIKGQTITIEVDLSPGIPKVIMVGLPDKSIMESSERIRTSFKSIGIDFPLSKITINLAPAGLIKNGSQYDLGISLGILLSMKRIKTDILNESIFLGELSLDGEIRKIKGLLPMLIAVKKQGFKKIFIPQDNKDEGALIKEIEIYPCKNLKQVINHLNGIDKIPKLESVNLTYEQNIEIDFKNIKGQKLAKRAMEIAAAGGHNIMMIGEPGCGKTLMARAFCSIIPPLSQKEVMEVAQIYSAKGLSLDSIIKLNRPFRAPHHTSSNASLVGGGAKILPGEVSLAHRGVLFLDEFAEFSSKTIETLRQPIEDGFVQISRMSGSVTYPSQFILICASNPTPGGFFEESIGQSIKANARYKAKLSGPISDRIDLHLYISKPKNTELINNSNSASSKEIKERVDKARDIQAKRFLNNRILTNSEMNLEDLKLHCKLSSEVAEILKNAIEKYNLSGRGYHKILKISRTIADLDNSQAIKTQHVIESLLFRPKNK